MKDQINEYLQPIIDSWKSLSGKTKKIILISAIGCVVFAMGLGLVLNNNPFTPLYTGISAAESSEIVQKLDAMGIEYRTSSGNVEVRASQTDQVKMRLAVEGYPKSGLSYDIFTNNIDLMSTDFEKNSFKIFQLQDRLRDTIKLISGVEDAVVTIAVPQQNNYVWKEDEVAPSASVVLKLSSEGSVSKKQVDGIVQLVAKSIPGLKTEDVAVVDNFGNDLASMGGELSEVSLSKLKLDIEKQMEASAKMKISNLLMPIYGEDNVRISVKCVVDVNRKITESISYIPNGDTDRGVIEKEQVNKESTVEGDVNNNVPGTESNTEVPTYPIVSENGETVYFKDQNSYDYLVSSIKEQIKADGSEQKDMTVAVAINRADISAGERADVQRLVAAASAINPEKVVVHNTVFEGNKTTNGLTPQSGIPKDVLIIGGIALAALILMLIIIMSMRRRAKHKRAEEEFERATRDAGFYNLQHKKVGGTDEELFTASEVGESSIYKDLNDLDPTDQQQLQKKLQEFTDENPEIVAKLLRSWLKGDEGRIE